MVDGEVFEKLRRFVTERNWSQFHTEENLAKSIAIEAAELLECYQWSSADQGNVQDELADVLTYCLLLADKLGLNPSEIVSSKIDKNAIKYPIDKAFGNSAKYDRL